MQNIVLVSRQRPMCLVLLQSSVEHLDAPEIRHFLYRSRKSLMVTYPEYPPLYSEEEERMRLDT